MADHLVFEPMQPVKQSVQVREQFQGLNYMVEIKKLHFKSFSRLGSYGVLVLSAEVMMQHHTTALEENRHVACVEIVLCEGRPQSLEMACTCLALH